MASGLAFSQTTLGNVYRSIPVTSCRSGAAADSARSTEVTSRRGRAADDQCCHLPLADSFGFAVNTQNQTLSRDIYKTAHNTK